MTLPSFIFPYAFPPLAVSAFFDSRLAGLFHDTLWYLESPSTSRLSFLGFLMGFPLLIQSLALFRSLLSFPKRKVHSKNALRVFSYQKVDGLIPCSYNQLPKEAGNTKGTLSKHLEKRLRAVHASTR